MIYRLVNWYRRHRTRKQLLADVTYLQAENRSLQARLAACERDRFTTRTKEDT